MRSPAHSERGGRIGIENVTADAKCALSVAGAILFRRHAANEQKICFRQAALQEDLLTTCVMR